MLYSFSTTLLEMEQKLRNAAREGEINTLYALIREDPNLLEKIDEIPFFDTPLHIAASVGQTHFAIEVMRLKPSFGRKLNPDGFSPMHLALQNYTLQSQPILADKLADTVRRLVKFDSELIRVQGKEGITPLHYVAQTGDDDLLADFLWACPASMEDLTSRCETATHIAVKNKHFQAFKVILGWLNRTEKEKVLNWKDENGNTVLHIAASTNQEQVVKLLVKEGLQKNAKNSMGFTALDVALQSETPVDKSIIDILRHAKVVSYSSLQNLASRADFLSSKERFYEKVMRVFLMGRRELSIDMRNLVLVVAVLVATATYQAALSPPGGVRQASDNNETEDIAGNTYINPAAAAIAAAKNQAGKVIMSPILYSAFMGTNTIAFTCGVGVILLVLHVRPYSLMLHVSLLFLMLSYFISVSVISPQPVITNFFTFGAWCIFSLIFLFRLYGHMELAVPDIKWLAGLHPDDHLQLLPFPRIIKPVQRWWMLYELIGLLDYSMSRSH